LDCVYEMGWHALDRMLGNVSRSLEPEGKYIVWSYIQPYAQTNPLTSLRYNWTVRWQELQFDPQVWVYEKRPVHVYTCTKNREDGKRVFPDGTLEADHLSDPNEASSRLNTQDDYFPMEDYLEDPYDHKGNMREPNITSIYTSLAEKYGWDPLHVWKEKCHEKNRRELLAKQTEQRKAKREEDQKNILKSAKQYEKRRKMIDDGLDPDEIDAQLQAEDMDDLDEANKTHTSIDTEDFDDIKDGKDPLEDYDPLQVVDEMNDADREDVAEGHKSLDEFSRPKPVLEEFDRELRTQQKAAVDTRSKAEAIKLRQEEIRRMNEEAMKEDIANLEPGEPHIWEVPDSLFES